LVKWIIVLVVGIAVILIGSAGRIPFTDISLALSEECANGSEYLLNKHRFDATWMRMPRTDDHHVRGMNEWTINDQSSGAMWRFYEDTGEIITVLGHC
jgi:hypothetical protein